MAEHDRGGDDYGFWKDEPTNSLRGLFSTGSHRRQRRSEPYSEAIEIDPTPTAAYDPWLDEDLDTVSFGTTAAPPSTGAGSTRSYAYDDHDYAWTLDDDPSGEDDAEIRRAAPLAPVHSGGGRGPIDPLMKRIGVIVGAIALALPLGLALRGTDAPQSSMKAPATAESATAQSSISPTAAADSTQSSATGLVVTAPAPVDVDAVTSTSAYPTSSVSAAAEKSSPSAGRSASASPTSTAPARARVESLPKLVCGYSSYRVVKGDFWAQIAKKAEVRLSDLLTVNQSTVDTPLFPGDKVCMPPNARSTSTSAAPSTTAEATTTEAPTTAAETTAAPTTEAPTTTAAATTSAAPTTAAPTTAAPTTAAPTTAAPTTAAPTTKPVQTSTPAGTAAPASYSRDQVIQIIRDVWPDDLEDRAIQIATRESSLKPGVRNWCCFGLFQIYFNSHKSWLAAHGVTTAEQLYDPTVNAKMAYLLYQRAGGWGPWSTA